MDKLIKSTSIMNGKSEEKHNKKIYPVTAADYELLEETGQGASATVYRAICIPFNEVVAIKNLDLEKCRSNLDEIRQEAQTMCLILHANVLRAHCSFVVDHSLWVVMPCLTGGSCLHIMKVSHPDGFEERDIAFVLKETLKALDYLHKNGHIHRDVKAGNILMDDQGGIKLGDFGVSACVFDTGDRQRSRNTFVGTPCWMAPEVMEQFHGYDFKADIWSFGITALELAHGHAPFSKYPPMKVLLTILQNAPPELDYERDRRFSKSFREMIAMCLVKDAVKRPSAEKLLKHSFFKNTRSNDYIAKHVLAGLPPLGERVKNLKLKDAALLAQEKMPYEEQEEKSQSEYKRGVSCWNFNVEDLKAEIALLQEDDNSPKKAKMSRIDEHNHELQKGGIDSAHNVVVANNGTVSPENDHPEFGEPPHSLQGEAAGGDMSKGSQADSSAPQLKGKVDSSVDSGEKTQVKALKDHIHEDKDSYKEKEHYQVHYIVEDAFRRNIFYRDRTLAASTGALAEGGEQRGIPLVPRSSSFKDFREENAKGPLVQKKGRFSVTSEDIEFPEPLPQSSASVQLAPTLMVHPRLSNLSRSISVGSTDFDSGTPQDGHCSITELEGKLAELQDRIASLVDELQMGKRKNTQLEKQLSAMRIEEGQRIKEGSAKGNG